MSCRKKIDSKLWNEWSEYTQTMESEVRNLRQEVSRGQDSLRAATRRCRELVRQLDGLSSEHERERLLRDQQLSRILRALLVLEARLKQEQKSIRQLLCEKDNVIRNQQLEIARLRRYTKSIIKGKREQQQQLGETTDKESGADMPSLESSDYQDHESGLSKDIQKLKCEIISKLNETLDENSMSTGINIRKSHSFAGSDISKTSLTSSENTDASIITTTTEGSPSLLSTEGFCEGESSDVSPGSTLNKSSSRCTPTIVTTDSETEVTMVILDEKTIIARSESKDDGMDCNYASDEDEEDEDEEPIYENNARNLQANQDCSNNNNNNNNNSSSNVEVRITRIDETNQDESSGNWYSDPDEDRINDEMMRHSVYRPNPSNHNSVLECVNQILLRDMEDEENILSVPRRFKHRGKIVRFQPARLSDIESVGSEMERRNSDEPSVKTPPVTITTTVDVHDIQAQDANDNESETLHDGFEATNSEDEFGMRIAPVLDPESGLEEDVDESKARPIVIIEPCVNDEPLNNSIITRSSKRNNNQSSTSKKHLLVDERISKSLDYEDIEDTLAAEIIVPAVPKVPPALPPKPQFRNNTLVLKKIPSPSFLIDETSQKKQAQTEILGLGSNNPLTPVSMRSLKFEDIPKKRNDENASYWKNRFNNVRSSFQLRQQQSDPSRVSPEPRKVTNIVRHFEEFKIEGSNDEAPTKKPPPPPTEFEVDEYDIQQNFEEFNLDECDLSSDDPDRPDADGSETFANSMLVSTNDNNSSAGKSSSSLENNNSVATSNNGNNYDSFLDATGLSNKSILTPSRLLSNHKSMLKPKDVKYKSMIKATAVLERHGMHMSGPGAASSTHTRHWTGPFV